MVEELNVFRDFVSPDELLYRVVYASDLTRKADGKVEVKPEAFRDRYNRPSVDRAYLRNFNPNLSRDAFGSGRGIIALYTREIRAISPLEDNDEKGNSIEGPLIDVESKPEEHNLSHAEIFGKPTIEKKNLFRRLRVRLSRIAEQHQDQIL